MSGTPCIESSLAGILQSLAAGKSRPAAAQELAEYLGATHLLIFIQDQEAGVLLPAPGFAQTLPRGLEWQKFTGDCMRDGENERIMYFPPEGLQLRAVGRRASNTCLLVAAGGNPDTQRMAMACSCLALMSFGFERERDAINREVQARIASETAAQAKTLAETLDHIRRQLDSHLEFTKAITDSLGEGVFTTDETGRIAFLNRVAERMLGWSESELVGAELHRTLYVKEADSLGGNGHTQLLSAMTGNQPIHSNGDSFTRKDGSTFPVRYTAAPIKINERVRGIVVVFDDLTEQRRMEQQLRETQKLESIGLLAGGIAHDFNNLLTGILGNASLALTELHPTHPVSELLANVVNASERAADLTRQLLAYAGKGQFQISLLDLSELARETRALAQATLPKSIDIHLNLDEMLPRVEGDRTQLHQLLMNLIINGAEAIGENRGGHVSVSTGIQEVDADYLGHMQSPMAIKPGQYVCLEVTDTGKGMAQSVKARIFDPFFTTKFTGRGLGLAAAIGIVRSHKGAIEVFSEVGKGSRFRILFPGRPLARESNITDNGTRSTILVVDDEEVVRRTVQTALEHFGYKVELAVNGSEAITKIRDYPARFALIILDLIMPVMGGDEALRHIRSIRPHLPVLLSSGYSQQEAMRQLHNVRPSGFLQKPFTAADLLKEIWRVHPPATAGNAPPNPAFPRQSSTPPH